jgi:hypothetical protein
MVGKKVTQSSQVVVFVCGTGKMLMEHETMKLKEQEEAYSRELKEWKGQLKPRKQVSSVQSNFGILKVLIYSKFCLCVY